MPIQLDEKTEITLPLKIVVGLGVAEGESNRKVKLNTKKVV